MTVTEKISYFSKLWKEICNVFPYFDKREIDFDRAYLEYLPRIMASGTDREYCLLLSEFINLLGDGHTDFSFPIHLRNEEGFLPFRMIHINGSYYLHSVPQGCQSYRLAEVFSINGEPLDDILSRAFRYIYHVDHYAYPSKLHAILPFLRRSTGNTMETSAGTYRFDLVRECPTPFAFSPLDAGVPFQTLSYGKLEMRLYDGNILYVKLPDLMYSGAAVELAAAIAQQSELRGVILDLRENEGGMTAHGAKIAGLFLSGQFSGCRKRTRTMRGIDISSASQYARMSEEAIEQCITDGLCDRSEVERCQRINHNCLFEEYQDSFANAEHRAVFDGPCILLTSRNTISAAEDLVAMFRSNRRATVIGTPTHGSTGTPLLLPLPIGGGARICSVSYQLLDGTEFIGIGIQPDIEAENSIDALRCGQDLVLKRALALLKQ